jgi:tetratricopeptide (TPR) repeat protein
MTYRPDGVQWRRPVVAAGVVVAVLGLACGAAPGPRGAAGPAAGEGQSGNVALVVMPEAGAERGPGAPVPSSADESRCAAAIAAVVAGDTATALALFEDSIVIGPALWALLDDDPVLRESGIPSPMHLSSPQGPMVLQGRTFVEPDRATLLGSQAFHDLLAGVASTPPRAATAQERAIFYQLIPFEIEGEPVTVVGTGAARLVFDSTDDKLFWLDNIGFYGSDNAASLQQACDDGDAGSCGELGHGLLAGGQIAAAESPLTRACDAGRTEACFDLSRALYSLGRKDEAEAPARRACDGGHLDGCVNLTGLLLLAGRWADAEAPARKACDRGNVAGCVNLANALDELGRTAEALEVTKTTCDAGQPLACSDASWYALRLGDAATGETLARQAVQALPDEGPPHANLGHALVLQGRLDEAAAEYDRAIGINAAERASILADLGKLQQAVPAAADDIATARSRLPAGPETASDPGPAVWTRPLP